MSIYPAAGGATGFVHAGLVTELIVLFAVIREAAPVGAVPA